MGQRTPFGTYRKEPSVNTPELRAGKKLSLYGTTEPRYCCTSSGYSRIASEMAQKITPCFLSSSRKVVATETESNTASTATPASRFRSSIGIPSFSNVSSSLGSTCSRLSSLEQVDPKLL